MDYHDWKPLYELILDDFGYDVGADVRARDVIASYATPFDFSRLDVAGKTVAIAGGAETLEDEMSIVEDAEVVFAASTAVDVLYTEGIDVDLMVTDLDKNPQTVRRLNDEGRPTAVHAHGDNVPIVRRTVPWMDQDHVIATVQCEPISGVYNFGGFTDGDRAAYLADHLDADRLVFPGWDFDDSGVGPEKRHKLVWAERLLYHLERRRGEEFTVLDGRRDSIDLIDL